MKSKSKSNDTKITPAGLFWRVAIMAAIPLLPFVVAYLWLDPYKVLRSYDDYFSDGLGVNKGVVTVTAFKKSYPVYGYDSFILGSSISCYYPAREWVRYLPAGAKPFHMDSSGQTIHNTRLFLEYIDRECTEINNVLIVCSPHILKIVYEDNSLPGTIPPEVAGGGWKYLWDYHYNFFKRLSTYGYYASYIPWRLHGQRKDHMPDAHLFEPQPIIYQESINEERIPQWDCEIETDSAGFYSRHEIHIPEKDAPYVVCGRLIDEDMQADFRRIAEILHRRGTSYRIIFSPTVHLEILCEDDDRFLRATFGDGYVNLTGEFREELYDRKNWYDNTHYRSVLATKFMQRAYGR